MRHTTSCIPSHRCSRGERIDPPLLHCAGSVLGTKWIILQQELVYCCYTRRDPIPYPAPEQINAEWIWHVGSSHQGLHRIPAFTTAHYPFYVHSHSSLLHWHPYINSWFMHPVPLKITQFIVNHSLCTLSDPLLTLYHKPCSTHPAVLQHSVHLYLPYIYTRESHLHSLPVNWYHTAQKH